MTEKRFTNIEHDYENAWIKCKDNGDFMIYAIYKELDESLPSLEDLLNGLSEENEQLKFERDRYKTLSEIRQESINNRILTIKEFIDNCSDKKVKKTLEQLFHSEVKEYDLSKKIRKLEKENEQLEEKNQLLYVEIDFLKGFIEERGFKAKLQSDKR